MLNWWLPENVTSYGHDIDWLFHLIYAITGVTFILVTVAFLAFLVIYRDRPGRQDRAQAARRGGALALLRDGGVLVGLPGHHMNLVIDHITRHDRCYGWHMHDR